MKQIDIWIARVLASEYLSTEEKENFCDLLQESRCNTVAEATFNHVMNVCELRRAEYEHDPRD